MDDVTGPMETRPQRLTPNLWNLRYFLFGELCGQQLRLWKNKHRDTEQGLSKREKKEVKVQLGMAQGQVLKWPCRQPSLSDTVGE